MLCPLALFTTSLHTLVQTRTTTSKEVRSYSALHVKQWITASNGDHHILHHGNLSSPHVLALHMSEVSPVGSPVVQSSE